MLKYQNTKLARTIKSKSFLQNWPIKQDQWIRQFKFFGHITRQQKPECTITSGRINKDVPAKGKKKIFVDELKGFVNVKADTIFEISRN